MNWWLTVILLFKIERFFNHLCPSFSFLFSFLFFFLLLLLLLLALLLVFSFYFFVPYYFILSLLVSFCFISIFHMFIFSFSSSSPPSFFFVFVLVLLFFLSKMCVVVFCFSLVFDSPSSSFPLVVSQYLSSVFIQLTLKQNKINSHEKRLDINVKQRDQIFVFFVQ